MAGGTNRHRRERARGEPGRRDAGFLRHVGLAERALVWLLPPIAVCAVFGVLDLVRNRLNLFSCPLVVGPVHAVWPPPSTSAVAGEVVGRLMWGLTASVFLLTWLAASVICVGVIAQVVAHHRSDVKILLWAAGLVSFAGWAVVGLPARRLSVSIPSLLPLLDVLGKTSPGIEDFAVALIRMALIIAIGFTFAGAGLLFSNGRPADEGVVQSLRERMRSLHLLLYAGAAVLVAGVLQVGALHHWALAALASEEARPLVPLVNALSMVIGTYWTLVLCGFYTPVMVLLRREARHLAWHFVHESALPVSAQPEPRMPRPEEAEAKTDPVEKGEGPSPSLQDIRAWLERQGLAANPKLTLVRVGALLGPFLAGGPLGAVVDLLKT